MHRAGVPQGEVFSGAAARPCLGDGTLLAQFLEQVPRRFVRLTGQSLGCAVIEADGAAEGDHREHPLCRDCRRQAGCPRSWAREAPALAAWPQRFGGRCPSQRWCAIVPVTLGDRCLAACKVLCPPGAAVEELDRLVELLDVLVENFTASVEASDVPKPVAAGVDHRLHPLVRRAIACIERHFHEVDLSVARVAAELRTCSTYIGHLFAAQLGVRMHAYIAQRRIELARKLLCTTDWQIKRIAFETGHHSADWFSHVFRVHTGLTPCAFRSREAKAGRSVVSAVLSPPIASSDRTS